MTNAHEKAEREVLNNPDYVIQESDFESVYGSEIVTADKALGDRLKHDFEARNTPDQKRMKQIADTFEAIVLMQAELSEWFGNATTLKTSKYDDYKNKIDMIAEWFTPRDGSRLLALAVDVTFGAKTIEEKLHKIKTEIDGGKNLGSIKYFKDARGDFMGTRNNVPRTIIGVSEPEVEELAVLWTQDKKKELGAHPIQRLFTEQIQSQLKAMHEYALKRGNDQAALAYEQALNTIRPIHASKFKFRSEAFSTDPVAREIEFHTKTQFS